MKDYFSWIDGLEESDPFCWQKHAAWWHDQVIADLDFTPVLECGCAMPIPHACVYVVTISCGCVQLMCEEETLFYSSWYDGTMSCMTCCRPRVHVVSGRLI